MATTGRDGWPHFAMLSSTEVFAKDRSNVRLATYDSSNTTKNLLRSGLVTLMLLDSGLSCYVKGRARLVKRSESDQGNLIFNVRVTKVFEDKMAGTRITGGVTFRKSSGVEPHEKLFEELSGP